MKSPETTQPSPTEESQHPAGEDAKRLLEEFVADGRSEATFQKVVDRLGALVYSSALRRTGDSGLAEEVAQNVFAALAHKASSLVHHKTLLAWIFKATRFEASKALRAERSRHKKHAAAAAAAKSEQPTTMSPPDDEEPWRDAVPLLDATLDELGPIDRQLVLERFYEGKKFTEIASGNGTTEAASKMRIKRALNKLSKLLTARGVSLSAAGIATALGSELATAAPAQVMSGLATNALAASSSVSTTLLTINTIEIMSTAKTVAATGATIIALAATPLLIQHSKANKLEDELASLEARHAAAATTATPALPSGVEPPSPPNPAARTIHDLLAKSEGEIDIDRLLDKMIIAMAGQDLVGMIEVFLPVTSMDQDEYEALIGKMERYQGSQEVKRMFNQTIAMFAPDGDSAAAIERLVRIGAEPYSYAEVLARWGSEDPAAAIAWFREKLDAGELRGTGIGDTSEAIVLSKLLGGVARKDPSTAIDLYFELAEGGAGSSGRDVYRDLADGLGRWMAKEGQGDRTELERLLSWSDSERFRTQVLTAAVRAATSNEDIAGAIAMAGRYTDDPETVRKIAMEKIGATGADIGRQLEMAKQHLPASELDEVVEYIVDDRWQGHREEIDTWLAEQPEDQLRDTGHATIAQRQSLMSNYQGAMAEAEKISDPERRDKVRRSVAIRWFLEDGDAARAALPAEMISRLEGSN